MPRNEFGPFSGEWNEGFHLTKEIKAVVTKIVSTEKIRQLQRNREKRAAQGSSGPPRIYGIIKKADEAAKYIIVTKKGGMFTEGKEERFPVETTTRITKNRREIPFSELKEGMRVSVCYTPVKKIATAINVYGTGVLPKRMKVIPIN